MELSFAEYIELVLLLIASVYLYGLFRPAAEAGLRFLVLAFGVGAARATPFWVALPVSVLIVSGFAYSFLNPLVSSLFAGIVCLVVAVAFAVWLVQIFPGVQFLHWSRIRIGDEVEVGDSSGRVVRLALSGLCIERPDGSMVFLPLPLVWRHGAVRLGKTSSAEVCVLSPVCESPLGDEAANEIRRAIAFSSFVSPGTEPRVLREENRVEVRFRVVRPELSGSAHAFAEGVLRKALGVRGGKDS